MTYPPACLFIRPQCCENRFIVRRCVCGHALVTNENPARSVMPLADKRLNGHLNQSTISGSGERSDIEGQTLHRIESFRAEVRE